MNIGDRVSKRGSEGEGEIIDINALWCSIKWDADNPRKPKICHARELERIAERAY